MRAPSALSIAGSLSLSLAAGAAPDIPGLREGLPRRADPVRVAGVRLTPGGGYQLATPWMPYRGVGTDSEDVPVYDSLDLDGGGGYLLKDDQGQIINIPNTITNMKVADEFRGVECQGADLAYWWTDNGTGNYWYIAIFTAEDVSIDCSLPAADHYYDGVIFTFNPLTTGYWYTPVRNLDAYGLFWTMPADGGGAWIISFLDGDNQYAKGPVQEIASGTSNNGGTPGRPGESTDPTWSDRDGSGTFDPDTECLSYAFGLDPDPLSTGIIFRADKGNPDCYSDCDHNNVLDLFDFLCFTNDFNEGGDYSDCNIDGAHDLFDFLCYINAFGSC